MNSHLEETRASLRLAGARVERVPVLMLLYPDNYVEAYADPHVDVHLAVFPSMKTAKGEILAEEYVALNLPVRHRELYVPGKIRAARTARVVTPTEIDDVRANLSFLRAVNTLMADRREGAVSWTL